MVISTGGVGVTMGGTGTLATNTQPNNWTFEVDQLHQDQKFLTDETVTLRGTVSSSLSATGQPWANSTVRINLEDAQHNVGLRFVCVCGAGAHGGSPSPAGAGTPGPAPISVGGTTGLGGGRGGGSTGGGPSGDPENPPSEPGPLYWPGNIPGEIRDGAPQGNPGKPGTQGPANPPTIGPMTDPTSTPETDPSNNG
ncbi:MAG: hypothetical protein H6619_03115 [Deltaproteobacteria bacterium]|nr:hypothetical protein [Deltaproteobacteria bacterium]